MKPQLVGKNEKASGSDSSDVEFPPAEWNVLERFTYPLQK